MPNNHAELMQQLKDIHAALWQMEATYKPILENTHPNYQYSVRNLVRYAKLRTYDLRHLQEQLSSLGLSSLAHAERYVLANLENILHFLSLHTGIPFEARYAPGEHPVNAISSVDMLRRNTERLLGKPAHNRNTHLMVTLPSDAVSYDIVERLLLGGMDIARINCSHDDQTAWQQMADNIRQASARHNLPCTIYMDLAGPKIRTGDIAPGRKKRKDYIKLAPGDLLELHSAPIEGKKAKTDEDGHLLRPARIACSLPSVIDDLQIGQPVTFDDGKIAATVEALQNRVATLRIQRVPPGGGFLKAEKGINMPDTILNLPALTAEDLDNLPFITREADIVGYSFVRKPADVKALQSHLEALGRPDIGIVLKIENKESLLNLPALLCQAMQSPTVGVMTARGDLAEEVGAERLSEAQEQIMWFCEAAFIPNIWATQVLESLAKGGLATRAEITDAAMSSRAECVMLNKGPFMLETMKTLIGILERMEAHQFKRKGAMRSLHIARHFFED